MKWRRDGDRFIFLAVSSPIVTDSEEAQPQREESLMRFWKDKSSLGEESWTSRGHRR